MRYIITTIEHSSSVGINSAPKYGTIASDAVKTTAAIAVVTSGRRSARRNTGT